MRKRVSVLFRSIPTKEVDRMIEEARQYSKIGDYEKAAYVHKSYFEYFFNSNRFLNTINVMAELENPALISKTYLVELIHKKIGKKQKVYEIYGAQFKKKPYIMPLCLTP
jgi:hypothetical protein